MGKCIYCGQNAGIFKDRHSACESKHKAELKAKRKAPILTVLNSVSRGELPSVETSGDRLPFKMQKREVLLYAWANVHYFESRAVRHWQGGNKGARIRVAKGLSLNVGKTAGRSVSKDEITHIDTGYMAITNKHFHFNGDVKGFRIKFDKIISLQEVGDALEIMRDLANPKPQLFQFPDVRECIQLIHAIEDCLD